MTSKYYVIAEYRQLGKNWNNIAFIVKYNYIINLDLINDFTNYCRDFIKKQCPKLVDFKLKRWVKLDEI